MTDATADAAGKTVSLFEPVKTALRAAFRDGSISVDDDVPEDGTYSMHTTHAFQRY